METYLFKFSACLAIFWLVYVLLLERQKMHRFKRFYLLGAFIAALIIPVLTITHYIESTPIVTDFQLPSNFIIPAESSFIEVPLEEPPFWNLETVLWLIYGLGVFLFSIRFITNLIKMYHRIAKNETIVEQSFIYVLLKEYQIPHSFFKYLFFNKAVYKAKAIPKEVLLHEETHAKQLHSLDILIIELLQIVFWFHPLIYILKHHIKLNHEFLADQAVLGNGIDTKTYQNILLQFSSSTQNHQLSSAINYSSIKKRFTVMKTQTSKTRIWLSSLLLLPIIAILFYSFAEREYVQKDPSTLQEDIANELKKANELQLIYINGASEKLMQEYRNFISKYKESNIIIGDKYERAVIIYDELMSDKQRSSVEKYPEQRFPLRSLSKVEPKQPTSAQFESWKDGNKFAISIDSKHVSNSELNNYAVSDIEYFIGSKVYKNARSKKFPQPFQFNLYTKKGFRTNYKLSDIIKYRKHTERYSKAIDTYLKGSQTDNSELRILKAQADKLFDSFSKEELKNYNILPAPPIPAANKFRSSQPKTKTSKGGPNFENTQETYNPSFLEYILEMEEKGASFYLDGKKISPKEAKSIARNNKGRSTEMLTQKDNKDKYIVQFYKSQGKVTQKQIAEYNTWAKKIHSESKALSKNATFYPPINEQYFIKFSEIYKRMSLRQKNQAVEYPFPGLISQANTQEKATKKQVAEYNKLAKHCNSQLKSEYPIIKVKDVKRVEYLYGIMSEDQKKNAESYPDFSKVPPPPPPATGLIEVNGETLFCVYFSPKRFYNSKGYLVDKNGKTINGNVQVNASDVLPRQYITKVFSNDKVVVVFKDNEPKREKGIINASKKKLPSIPIKVREKGGPNAENYTSYSLSERKAEYIKKYKRYESLRYSKPHFTKKSKAKKQLMSDLWVELRQTYFYTLTKAEKENLKLPITPFAPYVKINKDGKSYYKVNSKLTDAERKASSMFSVKKTSNFIGLDLLEDSDPIVIPIGSYTLTKTPIKEDNGKRGVLISISEDGTYAISKDNTYKNFEKITLATLESLLAKLTTDEIKNTFIFTQSTDAKKFRSKPASSIEYKDDIEVTLVKDDIRFSVIEYNGQYREHPTYQLILDNRPSDNLKSHVSKLAKLFKKYGISNLTI